MTKIVTRVFGGLSTVFILLASAGFCLAADEYVFRKVKWGMSPDEIKAIENAESDSELVEDNGSVLTYKMNIYDSEATVRYWCDLTVTGLESIIVQVKVPALGSSDLKSTEKAFREALNAKYGKMNYGENVFIFPETWQLQAKCIGLHTHDNQVSLFYAMPNECSHLKQEPKDKYKNHYGNL